MASTLCEPQRHLLSEWFLRLMRLAKNEVADGALIWLRQDENAYQKNLKT